MHIFRKTTTKVVLFISMGLLLVILTLQYGAKYMVEDFLDQKIPKHFALSYKNLDVNILTGNIEFQELSLKVSNRDMVSVHTLFSADILRIEDFKYIPFFFNKTISINLLLLNTPTLKYRPDQYIPVKKTKKQGIVNLLRTIIIDRVALNNGSFYLMKKTNDRVAVALDNFDFEIKKVKTGPDLITAKIPISYTDYSFNGSKIFADLGKYETLNISEIEVLDDSFLLKDITLASKYGKLDLSKHLLIERDYVFLKVPKIVLEGLNFGYKKDRFEIAIISGEMKKPSLSLFRDKRMPDDTKNKRLYGKLLRELPIDLTVKNFNIDNGYVAYEEKVNNETEGGLLFFEDVGVNISNISNLGVFGLDTKVKTSSKIMGSAKLLLDLSFNVSDKTDTFNASGELTKLLAENLNPFLEPNLRTRAKGSIDKMYFSFYGNSRISQGNIKMKYHDFKFQILNKEQLQINKFLTTIGNLFINDGSRADENGFRHGTINVERASNKSFFNYLWINLQDGMISTLTGNGKKDD